MEKEKGSRERIVLNAAQGPFLSRFRFDFSPCTFYVLRTYAERLFLHFN